MSGTPGIQGAPDVSLPQQGSVTPASTEKAQNPQRLNRSSIESLKSVQPQLVSSGTETKKTPLSTRQVSVVPDEQFESKLAGTRSDKSSRQLEIRENEIKALNNYLARDTAKPTTKEGFAQQIKEWENGISVVKKIHKEATKQAASGDSKLAIAEVTQTTPEALTSGEVQAQHQKEEVASLLNEFKSRLSETKQAKKEFEATLKKTKKLDAELTKLEAKLSKATEVFTRKATLGTGKEHKQQVKELEKEFASVTKALNDSGKLEKQAKSEEKKHPGATPGHFTERLQQLRHQVSVIQKNGPKAIDKAIVTRDKVLQNEAQTKKQQKTARQAEVKAKKQSRIETREMNRAYNKAMKSDRSQDRTIQKKQEQAEKRMQQSSSEPDLRKSSKPTTQSSLSGTRGNWTKEDEALAQRFAKLKASSHFEGITAEPGKNYKQLENQLWSLKSVDDLKQVVADRRSTKITPEQHRKYLGLLKSAVQGMAKNSEHAEKLNSELIKNLLKEQPDEARKAISLLDKTKADHLQKRLDRLRRG